MSEDFQQALELIQAIDRIRDSFGDDEDPGDMLDAIAHLLAGQFAASGCGILLLNDDGTEIEHLAHTGLTNDRLRDLGQQAIEGAGWAVLSAQDNAIGGSLALNGQQLGAIVLTRPIQSFTEAELSLLRFAGTQVDSAILQARSVWKILQRNRELEAIHEIDRLRDYTASEMDLISGFTTVLLHYFEAELCMIVLSHSDNGQMIVRGVVDKYVLPPETLNEIGKAVAALDEAQSLASPQGFAALQLLGAPLLADGQRLGGIVVGRQSTFRNGDHRLITAMMGQMDSAIQYSRVQQQLAQRKRELEVIYRIDHMRDSESDFDALLHQVLHELCNVIDSELGYIMLYTDRDEAPLELKAATTEGLLSSTAYAETIHQHSRRALETGQLIFDNALSGDGLHSIAAVPLILNERIIGVFGLVNSSNPRGFTSEDRRLLSAITSQVDTAIFERLEQRRMRGLLSRSVDPKVLDYLLEKADSAHLLTGERVVISILFADLRGSTSWTERTEPEELVATLNRFLGAMTDVIFKHGGTLDKFVGDEVIGLFGSPLYMADHAERAAIAALEMQAAQQQLMAELAESGHELPPIGMGISSGEVITGEFGPPIRTDFTAMGRAVNLGARLCSAAGAGQIYISQATYDLIKDQSQVNILPSLELKGISHPAPVYELLSLKDR